MADCLFCRIAAGEIPAQLVYEDAHAVAFRDLDPQAPVHVLVIPRRHVTSIAYLEGEDCMRQMEAIRRVAELEGILDSGFRVVTNHGPDAQQSVFHLHWHVLGGRPMGWPPG